MRTMRCNLPRRVPATVRPEFLGTSEPVTGELVAIESYEGCVPTLTWMAHSGHLFLFLPPHAFGPEGTTLEQCVDQHATCGAISVADLHLSGPGFARVGTQVTAWKEYIATVDWYEENQSLHLLRTREGVLIFVRNPRFQVGGERLELPAWKKSREVWTLAGPLPAARTAQA